MEGINIDGTKSTPSIWFIAEKNTIEIKGRSYPEDATEFYSTLLKWIENNIVDMLSSLVINIKLIYFNTSSSKVLMNLFDILEDHHSNGKEIKVNWYYDPENDLAQECGEEFKEDLSLPFEIIKDDNIVYK